MAEDGDAENELLDYEEEETETPAEAQATKDHAKKDVKGTYVSIHSSGFRDFLLKPELLRAIVDCGFEHPSEGKHTNDAYRFYSKFSGGKPSFFEILFVLWFVKKRKNLVDQAR